ncbi:MAG: hypothetical protein QM652_00915 [Legionella sp.]|uniref:hypothetical protein n=1 Tax=Legionella sp. TaxID=459 RepID=UPI0039E2C57A
MPENTHALFDKLNNYHTQLSDLFAATNYPNAQECIKKIQDYYDLSLRKSKHYETSEKILKTYKNYIELLAKLKSIWSNYNAADVSKVFAEQQSFFYNVDKIYKNAKTEILNTIQSRYFDVLLYDLYKIAELIFSAAAALSMYASIFLIALPMMLVQPPLGITVMITCGGLLLAAATKCFQSIKEFRTSSRHDDEYNNEKYLLDFFKPPPLQKQIDTPNSYEQDESSSDLIFY